MKLLEFLKTKQIPCIEVNHSSNVRGSNFYIRGGKLPLPRIEAETTTCRGKSAKDNKFTLVDASGKRQLYGDCHEFALNLQIIDPRIYGCEICYS